LLARAEAATAGARQHAADDIADHLWLYLRYQGRTQPSVGFHRRQWGMLISRWLAEREVPTADGTVLSLDRRALRKTFFDGLAARHGGAIALIAGINQDARTTSEYYLGQNGETPLLSAIIEETQRQQTQRARGTIACALVLDSDEMSALTANPEAAAALLKMTPTEAVELLDGEDYDVYAAKCKDFLHSPFGKPGSPCPAVAWDCMRCELAVIPPSKLPNLLAVLDHFDHKRASLTVGQWEARYGVVSRIIRHDILPRFSDDVVAAARAKAEAAHLYIPPEETG